MSERSVTHATFTIDRHYDAAPARVFDAWANPEVKERWFACSSDFDTIDFTMDFRVGGRETNSGRWKESGTVHAYNGIYHDIVPNERIVFSYEMELDGRPISVSLTTIELRREGSGTRMLFTEQGAFLDGFDEVEGREHGTRELLDALGRELERQAVRA